MTDLRDRVVLVTGGSAGTGRATVARLAAGGARVVTCARDGDRQLLVQQAPAAHGRLDGVVLDAAVGWTGLVEDTPGDAVETVVATDLTGVVELTRLALPHLLRAATERGRADVLTVSSSAGLSRMPPLTVCCATGAGVRGSVSGLRREVTARGVRVHSVMPGPVSTERRARGHGSPPPTDDDARPRLSPGISAERVADRVAGCLTSYRSRSVAVPRVTGLARLGEAFPVTRVLDVVVSRQADRIRRVPARMVDERIG